MPRSLAPVAVVCALTLLVTSCSLLQEESEEPDHEPTAISPDRLVHCDEEGDCGEAGAVRWSTPLEGEYHVSAESEGGFAYITAVREAVVATSHDVGAVVHEGTLYLNQRDHVSAVDAASGEVLWADEQVDPEQNKRVEDLQLIGGTLVLSTTDPRERHAHVYSAPADREGDLQWTRVEHPDGEFDTFFSASGEEHLLLAGAREAGDQGAPYPYHLMDAATGEITWSADLSGASVDHAFTEETLFVRDRGEAAEDEPDRLYPVDLSDGDEGEPVELSMDRIGDRVAAVDAGTVAVYQSCDVDDDAGDNDKRCTRPVVGVDASDGDELWEHPRPSTVHDVVEEDSTRLLLEDSEGHWWVDASDGEVLGSADGLDGLDGRVPEGVVSRTGPWDHDEGSSEETDPFRVEYGLGVPGHAEEIVVDQASGIRHVTDYVTGAGAAVSLFLGCAPDGLGQGSLDAPADGKPCSSPRLFAIDLGA